VEWIKRGKEVCGRRAVTRAIDLILRNVDLKLLCDILGMPQPQMLLDITRINAAGLCYRDRIETTATRDATGDFPPRQVVD